DAGGVRRVGDLDVVELQAGGVVQRDAGTGRALDRATGGVNTLSRRAITEHLQTAGRTRSGQHDAVRWAGRGGAGRDACDLQATGADGGVGDVERGTGGRRDRTGRVAGGDGAAAGGREARVGAGADRQLRREADRRVRVAGQGDAGV